MRLRFLGKDSTPATRRRCTPPTGTRTWCRVAGVGAGHPRQVGHPEDQAVAEVPVDLFRHLVADGLPPC
ncbi:hypothetical protein NKH77_20965 [Streptomyces sp. M19]